jgi:hypothetical protein
MLAAGGCLLGLVILSLVHVNSLVTARDAALPGPAHDRGSAHAGADGTWAAASRAGQGEAAAGGAAARSASSAGAGSRHRQAAPAAGYAAQALPAAAPSPPPKVALLFLAQRALPNEPVWRAFLEQAGRMRLPPGGGVGRPPLPPAAVAAAAARAQQGASAAAASQAALGADLRHLRQQLGRPLAPPLPVYPDRLYPGYMIQHGLTPGAHPPQQLVAAAAAQAAGAGRKGSRRRGAAAAAAAAAGADFGPNGSSVADGAGGAAAAAAAEQRYLGVMPWEELLVAQESARLVMGAAATTAAAGSQQLAHLAGDRRPQGRRTDEPPPGWQQFFSVYVHAAPGATFPTGSIFAGAQVARQVNTTHAYAQHALVQARGRQRLLLRAARTVAACGWMHHIHEATDRTPALGSRA